MNSRCFCPPDRVMNQASRFSLRPSCSSRRVPSTGVSYSEAQRSTASRTLMRFWSCAS